MPVNDIIPVCRIKLTLCSLDWYFQHAISIGQDIEGNVLFPEDNYEASSDYQEAGPQPEDKVYIKLQAINIWFIWLKYNHTLF